MDKRLKFKKDGESLFEWFIRTIAILMLFGITVSFIMSLVAPKQVEEVVEETITYNNFLEMVENLDTHKVEEIEKEQQAFRKEQPFLIKYRNHYKCRI